MSKVLPCFAHKTLQPCCFLYAGVFSRCIYPSCLEMLISPWINWLITLTNPLELYSCGANFGAAEFVRHYYGLVACSHLCTAPAYAGRCFILGAFTLAITQPMRPICYYDFRFFHRLVSSLTGLVRLQAALIHYCNTQFMHDILHFVIPLHEEFFFLLC